MSIILPVYNGGSYLRASVQSVLQQDYKNFEFLILDDCSTDESWKYIEAIKDDRIKLFKNETNKGLFYNLNFLIAQANSPLIKLWAQDDIMYPHCINDFVVFYTQTPNVGFCYCGTDTIDEKGVLKQNNFKDKTPRLVSPDLHARIAFFTGSIAGNIANVCIRKKALDKVGLFNETMKISADFDMWVRLAKDHDTGFIPQKLIQLRDHSGQLSRNENFYLNHVREDLEVYRYLQSYVPACIKKEGVQVMRNHKLVFYYTLMLKALLQGKFKTAYNFYKELSAFDNFFILSFCFIKTIIVKPKKPILN